jgi:cation transport ATPase
MEYSGVINGTTWKIGGREFVNCPPLSSTKVESGSIISEVWISDGTTVGRVTLIDEIRDKSPSTLSPLHELGIHTMMLTGDREKRRP